MIALDEPEQWRVVMLFDGEILGESIPYTSPTSAYKREAELRSRFPRHEVHVIRRTVTWTEET